MFYEFLNNIFHVFYFFIGTFTLLLSVSGLHILIEKVNEYNYDNFYDNYSKNYKYYLLKLLFLSIYISLIILLFKIYIIPFSINLF